MRKKLTARQQDIYDFISTAIRDRGYPPTIREIMEAFDIASTNGVRTTLSALEKKGYIRRHAMLSRGIELTDYVERESTLSGDIREIPLIGRVAAGEPILAAENVESTLSVDAGFVPSGDVFALKVEGDSMQKVGIMDGDIVLARQQTSAQQGEIVVAVIDEEATVKRYYQEGGHVKLMPENDAYEPIVVTPSADSFRIAGKIVGLMRRF
ncbi:MAG: transcriptional repressor LexA [Candidatus Latescibacteria bacterium]|jgi:repressor LexA|nr:transcriptional repressor LexA [Candidatus Latescibacterota bacterium]MBT4139384.1 transcriptional repressor LexA [Candidatus Latescibacterota bacterium]MBT5833164.1 transcriptional repressor LexA [Candidatus Latescibacterota bacterium]